MIYVSAYVVLINIQIIFQTIYLFIYLFIFIVHKDSETEIVRVGLGV